MRKTKNKKNRPSKWKSRLKAGCLALGMATAWGGEARSEVFLQVTANPTQTLTNAFVFYTGNNSINELASLGTITGGKETVLFCPIDRDMTDVEFGSCVLVGLYNDGTDLGVSISFPDDSVLHAQALWPQVFECAPVSHYRHTEQEYIDALNQATGGNLDPLYNCLYYRGSSPYPSFTRNGNEATLANFSDPATAPTNGGSVTMVMTTVPEPSSMVLLIGAAGALLFWRRDLVTSQEEQT
jgi:hypothetical protein